MNEITVIELATGETIQIREDAFDAKLHKRTEEPKRTLAEELGDVLKDARKDTEDAIARGIAEGLKQAGAGTPQRQPAAKPDDDDDKPIPRYATPAWERLYRTLPAWEQKERSAESDHNVQRWLRAVVYGTPEEALRIAAEFDPEIKRALSEGTAGAGGNLVPTPMSNVIVGKLQKTEAIGPRARQFQSANQSIEVPTQNAVMTAVGVAEGIAAGENDPSWGQVTLTKNKAVAASRASAELLEDSPFNIVTTLSDLAAFAFAAYNDTQHATAGDNTGTNYTDALDNNGSITEVDASVGALAYSDVTALYYALLSQYRGGAVWLCRSEIIKELAELVDATTGRQIFVPSVQAAQAILGGQENGAPGVGVMLGIPVVEAPMGAGNLFISNLTYGYGVLSQPGLRVEASRETAFLEDQVVWKFVQRQDGAVLQAEATKKSGGITES